MQICVRTKVSQTARAPILCPLAPLLSALPSRGSTEVRERAVVLPGWSPSRATGRHLARHLRSLRTAANTSGIHIPPYIIRYPRRLKVSGSGGRPTARRCGCAVRVVTRSRVDGVRASCTHTQQGTCVPCTSPVKTGNCRESSSWCNFPLKTRSLD